MKNMHLNLIPSLQSSEEAGAREFSLPVGNVTFANSTTSDALLNTTRLSLGGRSLELNQRVGVVGISGGIDGANHSRLAMVVLVLCAVEGEGTGVLDGHCKGWLTGRLASRALQESRVDRAIGLAGSGAGSSSGGDGMVSGNPDELDSVTNGGGDSSWSEDPLATCANLDLVGSSIGSRKASRSSNDGIGEIHG